MSVAVKVTSGMKPIKLQTNICQQKLYLLFMNCPTHVLEICDYIVVIYRICFAKWLLFIAFTVYILDTIHKSNCFKNQGHSNQNPLQMSKPHPLQCHADWNGALSQILLFIRLYLNVEQIIQLQKNVQRYVSRRLIDLLTCMNRANVLTTFD